MACRQNVILLAAQLNGMIIAANPVAADVGIQLACTGKVDVRGVGRPVFSEFLTASVVVSGDKISMSFLMWPCGITQSNAHGIAFECAKTQFGAGTMTGFLDRLTGDLELHFAGLPRAPQGTGMTMTYALACKKVWPLYDGKAR